MVLANLHQGVFSWNYHIHEVLSTLNEVNISLTTAFNTAQKKSSDVFCEREITRTL